ncbi:MAG: sigma-54-dependent Fis family transcriptional regulator [Bryobacterales bacterium]|nr:sigma-54-dependent Fis family transcriptional regulator [Bryobacterales bacterium]
MAILSPRERQFLDATSRCGSANPFTEELTAAERDALGDAFVLDFPVWSLDVRDPMKPRANSWEIARRLEELLPVIRHRVRNGKVAADGEPRLYQDGALHALYYRFYRPMSEAATGGGTAHRRWSFYREFEAAWAEAFSLPEAWVPDMKTAHVFGLYYQFVRAFLLLFENILGTSQPAARLRASVWRSIFTHDLRRYSRTLYNRMGGFATLITGPSGTGKEVVARSIARARYQPFDPVKLTFPYEADALFWPLNIAALTPTLVESELFGHRRGAFTGAMTDRKGYLESCPELGAVFLDELGEMSAEVQVKLLRVIEAREFTPVGDTKARRFAGKLIAATNRDLARAIQDGKFREDLYYRLCSDLIETPSLAQQLQETPAVLEELVSYMAHRNGADDGFAEGAVAWIRRNLAGHAWPGNYRELEQCVRNLLIRGEYRPAAAQTASLPWLAQAERGELTADALLNHYCRLVHGKAGTYEGAAEKLGLDRRTVKARVTAGGLGMRG